MGSKWLSHCIYAHQYHNKKHLCLTETFIPPIILTPMSYAIYYFTLFIFSSFS